MTSSMLRRQLKNLVQNYSEAEVKVREATSNDPWGPSSSQMADLSDLTYNVVACNEIMTMLWKRLKDDRNWRHIHKSLTLLEYLLKTGDARVLLKMKDNIYIVKALTEFRFMDKDGKDQGSTVREKAKVVLVLMEDDEKLKTERDFAVKTREKTSKNAAASSSDTPQDPSYKPCYVAGASGLPSLDNIPSVADLTASFAARKEERLRQEAAQKEAERRAKLSEEELQWEDAGKPESSRPAPWSPDAPAEVKPDSPEDPQEAADPWGAPTKPPAAADPWGAPAPVEEDPFAAPKAAEDPFSTDKPDPFSAAKEDPFGAPAAGSDPFSAGKEDPFAAPQGKPDPFNTPKGDPFSAAEDFPFHPPKDPFSAPKDDPFSAPKEGPFSGDQDSADPFAAPSTPKDDPFQALSSPLQDQPSLAPTTPPKDDPFNAPTSPPKDDPSDPFGALAGSPSTDAWEPTATSPPAASDPWGPAGASLTQSSGGDPWGDGAGGASPTSPADLFGDAPKPDGDPWGAPVAAPANADDAWGSPAPPPDSAPSDDPFGDGASKASDPWGAPSNAPGNTAGGPRRTPSEARAAAFLGSAGAMLVDLDSLLSAPSPSTGLPQPPPLTSTRLPPHPHPAGALWGPVGRTIPTTGVPPLASTPLSTGLVGSSRVACNPSWPSYGGVQLPPRGGSLQFPQPAPSVGMYHSGFAQPVPPYLGTGMVQSGYMGGNPLSPQQGAPPYCSPTVAPPVPVGGALQMAPAPSGRSIPPQGGGAQWTGGLDETTETNPFLI